MRTTLPRIITLIGLYYVVMFTGASVSAQGLADTDTLTATPPHFFGSMDLYYRLSTTEAASISSPSLRHNAFVPFWFRLGVDQQYGKSGVRAELTFGERAASFYAESDDPDVWDYVRGLEVYTHARGVKLQLGTYPIYYGFEHDDPYFNPLYTNSHVYSYTAAQLTGFQATIPVSDNDKVMLGVYNSSQQRIDGDGNLLFGGEYILAHGDHFSYFNVLGGRDTDEQLFLMLNASGEFGLSPKLTLAYDLLYHRYEYPSFDEPTYFGGVAAYVIVEPSKAWRHALRLEHFADPSAFGQRRAGTMQAVSAATTYRYGPFEARAELRYDHGEARILPTQDLTTLGQPVFKDDGLALTFAVLYGFGE